MLGVQFEMDGGGGEVWGKITPCLKLVRILLKTRNLAHKYILKCSFRKNIFQYQDPLNFADFSIFFAKNKDFLVETISLLKPIV